MEVIELRSFGNLKILGLAIIKIPLTIICLETKDDVTIF